MCLSKNNNTTIERPICDQLKINLFGGLGEKIESTVNC